MARKVLLLLILALILAGCRSSQQIGPRPAADVQGSVEAYLQRYQPGPSPRLFQTSHIYDRQGRLLAERWEEGRRTWVGLDDISKHLIDATIATEDATFYQNPGVDPLRIAGAALQNAREGQVMSGASTITMQLARNLFLGPDERYEQSMDRKLLEAGLAQELTALFSKAELLEMYLNLLNYGHLAYGPQAAAQVYFDKPAAHLSLAEATLLAGIPQQPADLDLFRNFAAAKARQRVVLDLMVRHGYLSAAQANATFAQEVTLNPQPDRAVNRAPHFTQYVESLVDARLGHGAFRRGGFQVVTTLDLEMQELAQAIVAGTVDEIGGRFDLNNASLVALKPGSFEIVVMVGSADFANRAIQGQVNVSLSPRQPGSAIKPVLYAIALEDRAISPATVIWDTPVRYDTGASDLYAPTNYDGRFHGPVTARSALANSYNVPAVKLLHAVGVERMLAGARDMGIGSLTRDSDWYGLSLTLGGGELTLLDLTAAYTVLASDGLYSQPRAILHIQDAGGRVVEGFAPAAPQRVLSEATAFLISDILSDNAARSPAFGANSLLRLSRPAAAKTGTTNDWRDNWTVGYTRYLAAGVWAGNTDGRPMRNTSGLTGAAPIWHEFMEAVLSAPSLLAALDAPTNPAAWRFAPPPDVEQRPECPPGLTCRQEGEYFSQAWLQAAGAAGPLADSVAPVAAAPVYADGGQGARWLGYCSLEPAAIRPLLRPPGRLGLPDPALADAPPAHWGEEQLYALSWLLDHLLQSAGAGALAVDLGPCDTLGERVQQAVALSPLAGDVMVQVLVDLAAALDPNAGPVAGESISPLTTISFGGGQYQLSGPVVRHDTCPGHYVIGQVSNRQGAPVAGVRLHMVDQWGNQALALSKSGAADAGRYDFLLNFFANRYTITVVDEAGHALSPPVLIEHLHGEGGDAPCHTVNWVGG